MKTHLNILPLSFRRRLLARQLAPRWACTWGVVTVLAALVCWNTERTLAEARRDFADVNVRAEPLRDRLQRNQNTVGQLEVIDERKLLVDCLEAADRPLLLVGIVSAHARSGDGAIQIQSFQLTRTEVAVQGQGGAADDEEPIPQMKLGLRGFAVDDHALSRFISQLRATDVFDAVELQTSSNVQLADGNARQYVVECKF